MSLFIECFTGTTILVRPVGNEDAIETAKNLAKAHATDNGIVDADGNFRLDIFERIVQSRKNDTGMITGLESVYRLVGGRHKITLGHFDVMNQFAFVDYNKLSQ